MSDRATQEERAAGQGYESLFVPALFKSWTGHMLSAVEDGARVLDVACGTGVLARAAFSLTGPDGHVAGVDPAPGMLATACDVEPDIDWHLAPAEDLPFEDASFDCVLSQFGMMFFQDKKQAVSEMFRVLGPEGQLAIAVWDSVDRNPIYLAVSKLLDDAVSAAAGDAVRLPFSLGDPNAVTGLLTAGGFSDVSVSTRTEQGRFPSARTLVEAELRGWLPLFGIQLDEAEIASVLEQAGPRLAGFTATNGEAVFPTSAHIITARRP